MYSLLVSDFGWGPGEVAQLSFISCNKICFVIKIARLQYLITIQILTCLANFKHG